jgi:hypothetical protein
MALTQKTGCLLIERTGPYGIVYFDHGRIVYASAPGKSGKVAIFDMLSLKDGKFHFVSGRISETRNCNCAAIAILMEWAYVSDEAARKKHGKPGESGVHLLKKLKEPPTETTPTGQ